MIRLHQPHPTEAMPASQGTLSSRLMRQLLVGGRHGIGQRVLAIGERSAVWTVQLESLGLEVDTAEDRATESSGFRGRMDRSDAFSLRIGLVEERAPISYDLILIDGFSRQQDNLLDLDSRAFTAHLLSRLRPEGEFAIVCEAETPLNHDVACWTRHLACFPGELRSIGVMPTWLDWLMWGWFPRKPSTAGERLISLKIPAEAVSSAEWAEHARRGLLTGSSACCDLAVQVKRKAA